MDLPAVPLDLVSLLFVPLMVQTGIEVKRNWPLLWDEQLTGRDRLLIQRIVIFFLVPVVVLFHELGHVAAIKLFGGKIAEFHYALMWGYVVPAGSFTLTQLVWCYLSGNLVQIVIGLGALVLAVLVRSPPVVALLVYLGLWSIGGTTIIYALLSLTGLYGDWRAIYTLPAPQLVAAIGFVHVALAAFVAFCLYGAFPRLWFAARTNPQWAAEQKALWSALGRSPEPANWLSLAWSFYNAGLYDRAEKCLAQCRATQPARPEALLLAAGLDSRKGFLDKAAEKLNQLLDNSNLSPDLRCRALLALGGCQARANQPEAALSTYDRLIELEPALADPHLYKGLILAEGNALPGAEQELSRALELKFSDEVLKELADRELKRVSRRLSRQK